MEKMYTINSLIYPDAIIERTIVDFKEVAEITFKEGKVIIPWENEAETEHIFNELINYATALIND
jgi:hypothetical protein